jgi:hypothetical protein
MSVFPPLLKADRRWLIAASEGPKHARKSQFDAHEELHGAIVGGSQQTQRAAGEPDPGHRRRAQRRGPRPDLHCTVLHEAIDGLHDQTGSAEIQRCPTGK